MLLDNLSEVNIAKWFLKKKSSESLCNNSPALNKLLLLSEETLMVVLSPPLLQAENQTCYRHKYASRAGSGLGRHPVKQKREREDSL